MKEFRYFFCQTDSLFEAFFFAKLRIELGHWSCSVPDVEYPILGFDKLHFLKNGL